MFSRSFISALSLVVATLALADDEAASRGSLEITTTIEKLNETTDETGSARTEPLSVGAADSGDEVIYTVIFKNVGDQRAENVLITNPIPPEIRYLEGSAVGPGAEILYSADGGETYATADEIRVHDATGRTRLASADDYTHIRWQLNASLDAGAQGFASFRAVVR